MPLPAKPSPRTAPEIANGPSVLNLLGWPYRPDLLRERLDAFESHRGNVRVIHQQALRDYPVRALAALAQEPFVDVVQTRDGLVGSWWSGRALQTMGDARSLEHILDAMWPHARQATSFGGQVVGLPYYSDVMVLAYNQRLLDRVGAPVPQTLEELTSISLAAAQQRVVEFSISLNLAPKVFTNLPWWGLVYASGGRLATMEGPDPAAVAVLEWLRDASAVTRIIDPDFASATYDALSLERNMFAIVGAHVLRRLNQTSPGTFSAAPVPGITGPLGTVAWTPLYSVATNAPHPTMAADLVQFLGGPGPAGDFATARFWLKHEGLIPAYRAMLMEADVQASLAGWVDPEILTNILTGARAIEHQWERWFLTWEYAMQTQVQAAIFGDKPAEASLAGSANLARTLATG